MKKKKWMILHFCILLGMCGCSSNGAGTLPGGNKRPDVKDVAWKVEEGIQEGERPGRVQLCQSFRLCHHGHYF